MHGTVADVDIGVVELVVGNVVAVVEVDVEVEVDVIVGKELQLAKTVGYPPIENASI